MRAVFLFALLSCSPACNRVDEPASSAEPRGTAVTTTTPSPPPSPSASTSPSKPTPSCLVESPAEAPPTAKPAPNCPTDPGPVPDLPRGSVAFPEAPGAPRITVEIAKTEPDRSRGLMYRTELSPDRGMLFSWPEEQVRTFWMRNTCIPLDMLFITADGTITGILEQVPVMNDAPRTVPCRVAHVLEVKAGWCRERGVKAGMRVTFEE